MALAGVGRSQQTAFLIGSWTQSFNHEVFPGGPGGTATDHMAPFENGQIYVTEPLTETGYFHAPFNAIHMCLIPKGPDRGKLLVWDRTGFVMRPGAGPNGVIWDNDNYWSFQCWSIVDPAPNPAGPRFRNYLVPVHRIGTYISAPTVDYFNMFCAGQTWSPFGDLVVAGGSLPGGAGITMLFRPDQPSQPWPGIDSTGWPIPGPATGHPLYGASHLGQWIHGPKLDAGRYYPTVTLTQRLTRLAQQPLNSLGRESACVFGGSVATGSATSSWNSYEALVVTDPAQLQGQRDLWLTKDQFQLASGQFLTTFPGPSVSGHPDLLEEYPRMHLLDNGKIIQSGYDPTCAQVPHETPPTPTTNTWDYTAGQQGPAASFLHRHDGASVFYARSNSSHNLLARMGGSPTINSPATRTTEFLLNATQSSAWIQGPDMIFPRVWLNSVQLPNGDILVVGGAPTSDEPVLVSLLNNNLVANEAGLRTPELFRDGVWQGGPKAATLRGYHATAVLLEDGRVAVGGGELRHEFTAGFDYEIFSPWYMDLPRPAIALSQTAGVNPDGSHRLPYGSTFQLQFTLPPFLTVGKVVLLAPGAMTHHSDMSARYIELTMAGQGTTRTVTVPPELKAPRGFYMLFAVTTGGVPSVAQWVQVIQ